MKKLIVFCLGLLLATPASAEFSAAEKAQVENQYFALNSALNSAYQAVQYAKANPTEAAAVANYVRSLVSAWRLHQNAVLYLIDMNGADSLQDGRLVLGGSRASVVATALAAIQQNGYATASSILDTQLPGATTARSLLNSAMAGRAAIDTTLAYDEPRMDVNMAIPGATRDKSSAIGPHGDYRIIGEQANLWFFHHAAEWTALANAFDACPAFLQASKGPPFTTGHLQGIGRGINIVTGLAHANEWGVLVQNTGLTISQNVDLMEAGGTTTRPREFFDIQLALEVLAMWTHVGPEAQDVNGRTTARGLTYDLEAVGREWGYVSQVETLCDPSSYQAFRDAMATGMGATSGAWGRLDNMAYHGMLLLRHFQVFPAPPPSGGGLTCGVGTTESNGECVADIQSCGANTTLVGTECVSTCQTCGSEEVIVDNLDPNTSSTGQWLVSSGTLPYAADSIYCNFGCTFRWLPSLEGGTYEVFVWYTGHPNRENDVVYRVNTTSGIQTVIVDQTVGAGAWVSIGTYVLDATSWVEISSENGQASADAVRFVLQ